MPGSDLEWWKPKHEVSFEPGSGLDMQDLYVNFLHEHYVPHVGCTYLTCQYIQPSIGNGQNFTGGTLEKPQVGFHLYFLQQSINSTLHASPLIRCHTSIEMLVLL